MIVNGVRYPVIHFCRVILYLRRSPFVVSPFSDEYLEPVLSSPGVFERPLFLPLDATLLMIHSLHHLLKTLSFPSGKGVLTH